METNIYQHKYLKYKQKYVILKELMKGGYGKYSNYWNEHAQFNTINNRNKTSLLLSKEYNSEQYQQYLPMLNNLLNIDKGLINLDFINNFYRNIYFDITNQYLINVNSNSWENPENNRYNIERYINTPNSDIVFIKNKEDINDTKVIKVFTKINVNIEAIKDYLSLLIIHIIKNATTSFQQNYITISPEEFELFNFNCQTNFITDQDNNKLYLACRNNDAVNDYIINIILQKINSSSESSSSSSGIQSNIVKYHNLCVLPIRKNGKIEYKYCIIMDKFDGSLFNLIGNREKGNTPEQYKILTDIITNVSNNLNSFKNETTLFTHTDMKCENIFYKEYTSDDTENTVIIDGKKYKLYLADFDKSSITYNNIRFYNDISSTNELFKTLVDQSNPLSPFKTISCDEFTKTDTKTRIDNFNKKEIHPYRLSRTFRRIQADFLGSKMIETEQLYMRYNYQPYYLSFDYCSFIVSLYSLQLITELPKDPNDTLNNIINKYITITDDNKNMLLNVYNRYIPAQVINGNFGELLNPLLSLDEYTINKYSFNNTFLFKEKLHINKLYIDKVFNKVLLSIPCIINIIPQTGNITSSSLNSTETLSVYKLKELYIKYKKIIDNYITNIIELDYNNDIKLAASLIGRAFLVEPTVHYKTLYSKTNRFSHLTVGSATKTAITSVIPGVSTPYKQIVQEIIQIKDDELDKILQLFNTTENNNNILDKNPILTSISFACQSSSSASSSSSSSIDLTKLEIVDRF